MFKKKADKNKEIYLKIATTNSVILAESVGVDLRRTMVFPDNARYLFTNVNARNIRVILNKNRDSMQFESIAPVLGKLFNRGRKGIVYVDKDVTMAFGEFDAVPNAPYKIYYKNDSCAYAIIYADRPLEIIVTKNKKIIRYYDDCHEIVRFAEIYDGIVHEYLIDREASIFTFKEYPEE